MYLKSNAPEVKWIIHNAPFNDFARSLDSYLLKHGTLTEPMFDAVRKTLVPAREAVDVVGVARVAEAFATAQGNGVKRPKLYLGDFTFKLAPPKGRNANAIYVTEGETYLGKIIDAKFHAARDCSDEKRAEVVAVCANPAEAAIAYGQRTGICSCCARELTDPVSIERGIGPICETKYGF